MDENINAWPKFQWSLFVDGKTEQVVVRGDDYTQWVLDVEAVRSKFRIHSEASVEPVEEVSSTNEEYWVREVKKEGPNKGKRFKVAKGKDGAFLGWTNEPLSVRE